MAIGHFDAVMLIQSIIHAEWKKWSLNTINRWFQSVFNLKVTKSKYKQFNVAETAVTLNPQVTEIISRQADAGREGELIVRKLLLILCNVPKKPMKRLWIRL